MSPNDAVVGKTVYFRGTNKKGVITKKEKYHYNLRYKFTVKWEDGTETVEIAANLLVNSKDHNENIYKTRRQWQDEACQRHKDF